MLLSAEPAFAAGLGTPSLSSPLEPQHFFEPAGTARFFDTDRFLTTAGVKYSARYELSMEPELGIGYRGTGQELRGGIEQSTHRLHALAGWRLSLADSFYFSAGAKLSMVTVETTGLTAGQEMGVRPDARSHAAYDFMNLSRAPRWSGELGLRLTPRTDLMLYYDQDPLTGWSYSGQHQEERIGTRFIIRFR